MTASTGLCGRIPRGLEVTGLPYALQCELALLLALLLALIALISFQVFLSAQNIKKRGQRAGEVLLARQHKV